MIEPLSPAEQAFAEENHKLIYAYLHRHKLNVEEWYDIAAIGYCIGVKAWFKNPEYGFGWIAFCYIGSQISHEFSARQSQKRTADVISYDVPHDKELCFLDSLPSNDDVEAQAENSLLVNEMSKRVSPYSKQKKLVSELQ